MKKIIIIVVIIAVLLFIGFLLLVNNSTKNYDLKLKNIQEDFQSNNRDAKIISVKPYYGTKTYYVLEYKNETDTYINILNYDGSSAFKIEKNKLCQLDKKIRGTKKIGMESLKPIIEVISKNKNEIKYTYYDALTCDLINNINVEK